MSLALCTVQHPAPRMHPHQSLPPPFCRPPSLDSRLQAAAVAFGESCSLPIPEIVAIGGQSDGKSSLMEAFLGVGDWCS